MKTQTNNRKRPRPGPRTLGLVQPKRPSNNRRNILPLATVPVTPATASQGANTLPVNDNGLLANNYKTSVENPAPVTTLKFKPENAGNSSQHVKNKAIGNDAVTSSNTLHSSTGINGVVRNPSNTPSHEEQVLSKSAAESAPNVLPQDIQEHRHLALVHMLRQETAQLKRKNASLEEANFSLQTEIMCKAAEEKHGRSKVVESLEVRLSFQKKELENALEKIRKLEREKTRSLNVKAENSTTKSTIPRTQFPMQRASTNVSFRGNHEACRNSDDEDSKNKNSNDNNNWKTLVHHLVGNDQTLLKVLLQADKTTSNALFSSLVSDVGSASFIVGTEMRSELIKVASALIDITCQTKKVHAMVLLRKILVIAPTNVVFSIEHPSVKRLFDLLMTVNPNGNDEEFGLHKAIADVLLIISKRPCRPCGNGKFFLNQLGNPDMKHTRYTIELYAEVAATQIIQCMDDGGAHGNNAAEFGDGTAVARDGVFMFPNCTLLFQKFTHTHMDTAIVRLCATLIAVMKPFALQQLYKQNLTRELVFVLNRMSTNIYASILRRTSYSNKSGSESPKAAFRATSSLFLLLVRHYLDLKRKSQSTGGETNGASSSSTSRLHGSGNGNDIDDDGKGKHELISTLLTISRLDKELKTQVQPMLEELLTLY